MLFERFKYSAINFICFFVFLTFFCVSKSIDLNILLWISVIIGAADVIFIDGYKYGTYAYGYLLINRSVNFFLILMMCNKANSFYFWLGFAIYCIVLFNIMSNQWDMIYDDILCDDLEDCYKQTLYELNNILSESQKNVLEELEKIVDQDKMFIFIATFDAKEIQKLLNIELWGIAFLIQKEDFESMLRMVEKMK